MNRNIPEPTQNGTKKSLLARIVEGETPEPDDDFGDFMESGAMDDPTTPNPTPEPPRRKRRRRTAPKGRTDRRETEKQYRHWAKLYDPDQQCKRYLKKYWGA